MPSIRVSYEPPSNGWLKLQLRIEDHNVEIDASDVPNNPVQELIHALELAAGGTEASVRFNLEPDGYFIRFKPIGQRVQVLIEFATGSKRSRGKPVAVTLGGLSEVLLPFWRFLRSFESHKYQEPHWPSVDFSRLEAIKSQLDSASEA